MKVRDLCTVVVLFALAAQAATDPEPVTVRQKDRTFSTAELTVKVGEKVRFTNDDAVVHNVFSSSEGFDFNLKTQKPGEKSEVSFDKEGTVEVRCAIHPTMKLRIKVSGQLKKD